MNFDEDFKAARYTTFGLGLSYKKYNTHDLGLVNNFYSLTSKKKQ